MVALRGGIDDQGGPWPGLRIALSFKAGNFCTPAEYDRYLVLREIESKFTISVYHSV